MNDRRSVDLLIVGGGVMGLWVAKRGLEAGMSILLLADAPNATPKGGSANPLGALMPHAPDRWGDLAAFQFQALIDLETEAARLEEETGIAVGYQRIGRLTPLRTEAAIDETQAQARAAAENWRTADGRAFTLAHRAIRADDPIAPAAAPLGVRADDLTARIAPRAYLSALRASLTRGGSIHLGAQAVELAADHVRLATGETLRAGAVIVAAGAASFALLSRLTNRAEQDLGRGIKGQAAIFEPPARIREQLAGAPMLYAGGLYITPHADGRIAVGATTERNWRWADRPDAQAASLAAAASALCPALAGLQPSRFWAGLRPRTASRMPAVGALELANGRSLWIATGGYKISFGLAHRAATALIEQIRGDEPSAALPAAFAPALALTQRPRKHTSV
ncbi:MAG: FAD-binding oxidoreductase [Neomegalonema sp.]|nr:FAD-binding oxidoreductase [Neomegalonema sp.]